MFGSASKPAAAALERAAAEASRRGDRRVGTEHLLLGLLGDARVAESLETDLERARTVAAQLDRDVLISLGIDLEPIPAVTRPSRVPGVAFTSGARHVIARAVELAHDDGVRIIDPEHLLAALLERSQPDPVADLLLALNIPKPR